MATQERIVVYGEITVICDGGGRRKKGLVLHYCMGEAPPDSQNGAEGKVRGAFAVLSHSNINTFRLFNVWVALNGGRERKKDATHI